MPHEYTRQQRTRRTRAACFEIVRWFYAQFQRRFRRAVFAAKVPSQGKDFSLINHLRTVEMGAECNYNNIDGIIGNNDPKDEEEKKKTLFEKPDYYKAEAERNAAPIDGCEPAQEHPAPEKGRNLV